MQNESAKPQGAANDQPNSNQARKALRMAEREMDDAFRLTDQTHPMMQELRRLCTARRIAALTSSHGANDA